MTQGLEGDVGEGLAIRGERFSRAEYGNRRRREAA